MSVMLIISEAEAKALQEAAIARLEAFHDWFDYGLALAGQSAQPDSHFHQLASAYALANRTLADHIPPEQKANLVCGKDEADIAVLEKAGASFASLHKLAKDAYTAERGMPPLSAVQLEVRTPYKSRSCTSPCHYAAGHFTRVGWSRMPRAR